MKLGVIGGLGPMATAYFMELVTKMTDAKCDQEHLDMIIYSCPSIPDRTGYILGKAEESPFLPMLEIGKRLRREGVDIISIPCVTAHFFIDDLKRALKLPIIDAVEEMALVTQKMGLKRVGIMCTDGTLESRLFQNRLEDKDIECIIPSRASREAIMDIIYRDIKAGRAPNMGKFYRVAKELWSGGAQAILLGCTELSLIKREFPIGTDYIDILEIMAWASIAHCQKQIKKEYSYFIAKKG
ncbi:MAG: amino acid racemase [Clostridiales bacterium]|nr:amino acid racemase [Clostridiales bacterium]